VTPEIGIDRLGGSVKKGELLGRNISPHSFEKLESSRHHSMESAIS
jgi:hypothetical protein